jgi:lipid-binding SYLF domain-containing protein
MLFLETNIFTQNLPAIIFVLAFGLFSYFISRAIAKKDLKLVFLIPGIMLVVTIVFGALGLLANDWSALGYLIIASLAAGAFIGSLVASLILYFQNRSK